MLLNGNHSSQIVKGLLIRSYYRSCFRGDRGCCNCSCSLQRIWSHGRCQRNPPAGDTASWPGAGSHLSPCARRLLGLVDHKKGLIDRGSGWATTERLCSETYGSISSMSPCPRCNTHRHTGHGHAHSFQSKRAFKAFRDPRLITGWIG